VKVFTLLPTDDLELCRPDDWKAFNKAVAGGGRAVNWQPFSVRIVHWNQGDKLGRSDVPWWASHVLIFRREAADKLAPYLGDYGELLPLECEETPLVAFRASRVLDALSEEDSSFERLDDGTISMVWRYAFKPSIVEGQDIFTLPNDRLSPLFVGDGFVKKWKASRLTGLEFDEVWRSAD
jgi:hypothetical protein